jgi:hypothetical protein
VSSVPGNHQVLLNDEQTLVPPGTKHANATLNRPRLIVRESLKVTVMDTYTGYREAPLARSPTERVNWGVRDEVPRPIDRADRSDTFYRGRSPGTWGFLVSRVCFLESYLYERSPLALT